MITSLLKLKLAQNGSSFMNWLNIKLVVVNAFVNLCFPCSCRHLMTDRWPTIELKVKHKHKTKTQEAWQRAIKSKEKFKEEVEDNFFRDWFSVKMFLNLFFEQFIFDVHKQICLEQPILIQIFSVTCTFYFDGKRFR